MYDTLVEADGDVMYFELNREPEVGRTFSAEGLDDIFTALQTFVGARITAHWAKRGVATMAVGPHRLRLGVSVGIDGAEPVMVGDEDFPWYVTSDNRAGGLT
jgi:hypothetical protein